MANFNSVPTIHAPRSRFNMSFSHKTSGNVGTLYPFYLQEIYPGDTFEVDATFVTRLASAYLKPVMDDLFLDVYYFFVPGRLCFDKFQEIFGENTQSAWVQSSPVAAPTLNADVGTDPGDYKNIVAPGSVADHFGLPLTIIPNADDPDSPIIKYLPKGINILPFRAFATLYNDWFRDENIVPPMHINKSTADANEWLNGSSWSANNYCGMCPKVAKFHDYFTSSLPGPQKGDAVQIPLNLGTSGFMHIRADEPYLWSSDKQKQPNLVLDSFGSNNSYGLYAASNPTSGSGIVKGDIGPVGTGSGSDITLGKLVSTNLGVDLPTTANATVNDLRFAFQLQKILERAARSGSRYTEFLLSAFNVLSPDARLQRSEYLGGKRMPLSVQQVAQTSSTSDTSTLAELGAFSLSSGKAGYTKGFVEHGYVIGVFAIRQRHSYQQGIERFWSRSERFSYYDPAMCNIGEQPVYKDEIFGLHSSVNDPINSTPFGYQEAWADLRYRPNYVTGAMRSDSPTSLDIWHFADDYANAPTLNKAWLEETPEYVDRTIAVPSSSMDQFIFDIYIKNIGTRRLPTYSVPSLIDHH